MKKLMIGLLGMVVLTTVALGGGVLAFVGVSRAAAQGANTRTAAGLMGLPAAGANLAMGGDAMGGDGFGDEADVAFAGDFSGPQGRGGPGGGKGGGDLRGQAFEVVAAKLSLTTDELKTEMQTGKSIAQIAQDKNVTTASLVDAVVAAMQTKLDAAVTAGKITQAEEDAMIVLARGRLTDAFERVPVRSLPSVAAEKLGLTVVELQAKLVSGTTLRSLIEASGSGTTVDAVLDAVVASHDANLDAKVKSGDFTQAEADATRTLIRARAERALDVDWSAKQNGGHGGHRGGPQGGPGQGLPFGGRP